MGPPYTLAEHDAAVESLSSRVASFHASGTAFRINHGSTNSTRTRDPGTPQLNISHLNNILSIDPTTKTAVVEPNVPLDALLTATLKLGLMPPVVMEFPGITVGGGFSGASGESTCWREGLFDCSITSIEIITGDGRIMHAEKNGENADLFNAARCSLGTMGVVTLLTIRLVPAKDFVEVTYHRETSIPSLLAKVTQLCEDHLHKPGMDFIEAIIYSKDSGVIITGRHASKSEKYQGKQPPIQRFDRAWDPWFYQHARAAYHGQRELVPTHSYLFRHDRGAFWSGETFFTYFGLPSNRFTRAILNPVLTTRAIYKSMHANNGAEYNIVQDLILPVETSEKFVDYVAEELNIFPIWVCPVRKKAGEGKVWGWPMWKKDEDDYKATPSLVQSNSYNSNSNNSELRKRTTISHTANPAAQAQAQPPDHGELTLNFGVWGQAPSNSNTDSYDPLAFRATNRRLEAVLRSLHGMKVLYAQAWYMEPEFWELYDKQEYERLRRKWGADESGLPSVWEKIRRREEVRVLRDEDGVAVVAGERGMQRGWRERVLDKVLRTWPLGGLYSVWRVVFG